MKITSKMRFGFMLLVLSSSMMLYSCGDKIVSKPVEMCDTPDLSCVMFFMEYFNFFPGNSCYSNLVLNSGDILTFIIDPVTLYGGRLMQGCSSNPWTLTATPPAGATVFISQYTKHTCSTGVLLAQSAAAGLSASISGPAGCMTGKDKLIIIEGRDVTGTVTVTFN